MRAYAPTIGPTPRDPGRPAGARVRGASAARAGGEAELAISPPGDVHEQEADRIAGAVVGGPATRVQRSCPCGGGCPRCRDGGAGHGPVQTTPVAAGGPGAGIAPPLVHDVLGSPGQPLDAGARAFMEARLGYGFGQVRIHADARAEESARAVGALAYTVGDDIVFGAGRYAPETAAGRRLLAHELAHVLQQQGTRVIQRQTPPGSQPAAPAPTPTPTPGLRIAAVRYDPQGNPLSEKLSEFDRARVQALLDGLQAADPGLFAAIQGQDILVATGELPEGQAGAHLLSFQVTPPGPASFSSVLVLDLDEIYEAQQAANAGNLESALGPSVDAPRPPQSALATLRHELGHLLFQRAVQFDQLARPLPETPLPEPLQTRVEARSRDESITTDVGLLSEFAAEAVEQPGAGFSMAGFTEENDPRFGIGGYHDVDGNAQAPTGFGVRMARGLTLIAAKQAAREIMASVPGPVFLLTVPTPAAEQRLFDVLMLTGPDRKAVREAFDALRTAHPALEKFEAGVVAY
jgi:hypothetical protein